MFVVDIWNSKTKTDAGPAWFTDDMTLTEALNKAKEWVENKPNPEHYHIMYRIVGCL